MSTLAYRPDIDGLRAIAVLSVIAYHTNSNWLPGGFVGVDIFFVISGFLITQIIHHEIQQKNFAFQNFYLRRIKRILPPLFLIIAISLAAGFFLLAPNEYTDLAKSARYAVFFLANHHFSGEQDYFAPAAEETPLLHLWSLSVEEQYYFLWPSLLLLISRHSATTTLAVTFLLTMGSFFLATGWALRPDTHAMAYYLLPARFGELMIGSLLALMNRRCENGIQAHTFSIAGLGLVLASCVLLNKQSLFPGYNALWPCLGTALLIYAGSAQQKPIASKLLSLRIPVFIGLLSYSLYLWHWPILAFTRYYLSLSQLSPPIIAVCLFAMFIAAWLSWRFVEQPVRKKNYTFSQAGLSLFIVPSLLILIACVMIKVSDGHLFRDRSQGLDTIESQSLLCHNQIGTNCQIGDTAKRPRTLIVGDSHAAHLSAFFHQLGQQQGWSADMLSADSCPSLSQADLGRLHHDKQEKDCRDLIRHINAHLDQYDNVVIALRWELHLGLGQTADYQPDPGFAQQLASEIQELGRKGKQVFLVSQVPLYQKNPYRLYRTSGEPNFLNPAFEQANQQIQSILSGKQSAFYLDTAAIARQWSDGMIDGLPAYKDENHLNLYGQRKLAEQAQSLSWLSEKLRDTSELAQ